MMKLAILFLTIFIGVVVAQGCKDNINWMHKKGRMCSSYKGKGYCKITHKFGAYVRKKCKKTCGLCDSHVARFCEHKSGSISCPLGRFIDITYANYGKTSNKYCWKSSIKLKALHCRAKNSFIVVKNRCAGKNSCVLSASNSWFGDPCRGVRKYLEVEYQCLADSHVARFCEHKGGSISCPLGRFIDITYANYGKTSNKYCGISSKVNCRGKNSVTVVKNRCNGRNSCVLSASNSWFRDPCRGVRKYLEVKYQCLAECNPPKAVLQAVHKNCLDRWTDMFTKSSQRALKTLPRLQNVCPSFCKQVNEGNCVWDVACKRCKALLGICKMSEDFCTKYIQRNENRKSLERCPQYEYCQISTSTMALFQHACNSIYESWQLEANKGVKVADLSDPCNFFCLYKKVGCGWRIMCRKCLLLVKLKKKPGPDMQNKFNAIMAKGYRKQCSIYTGKVVPFWYFNQDWF